MKKRGKYGTGSEEPTEAFQGVFADLKKNGEGFTGLLNPVPGKPILCHLSEPAFQFAIENRMSVLRVEGTVTSRHQDGSAKELDVIQIDEIPWTRGRVQ